MFDRRNIKAERYAPPRCKPFVWVDDHWIDDRREKQIDGFFKTIEEADAMIYQIREASVKEILRLRKVCQELQAKLQSASRSAEARYKEGYRQAEIDYNLTMLGPLQAQFLDRP